MGSRPAEMLEVLIVTGLSGAGRSTALNALEDLGYYCVDNLPPPVLLSTLDSLREAGCTRVALGLDVRLRAYLEGAAPIIELVEQAPGVRLSVLYVDASEDLLARRFNATRRPHPLVQHGDRSLKSVREGIALERELLSSLRELASVVIDTTGFSVHDLRREVLSTFSGEANVEKLMSIRLVSFGFKYGAPQDADLVFDVRFLKNPYFVEDLRPLSGQDEPVCRYVLSDPDAGGFLDHVLPLLRYCMPRFRAEGKSYLTIAVGCTGGRHRSVVLAETIASRLSEDLGLSVEAVHRDIRKAEHLSVRGNTSVPPPRLGGSTRDKEGKTGP